MIACDTNMLVAYLQVERGADIDRLDLALAAGELVLPPVVLTEILSDPTASKTLKTFLEEISLLNAIDGYWERAGLARADLRRKGLKAKTADTLIAQSCVDHDVALLTRDADFRHFAKHCGLRLA